MCKYKRDFGFGRVTDPKKKIEFIISCQVQFLDRLLTMVRCNPVQFVTRYFKRRLTPIRGLILSRGMARRKILPMIDKACLWPNIIDL